VAHLRDEVLGLDLRAEVADGDPASRMSMVPAARSASACARAVSALTAPSGPRPMWQCASTSPGMIQPSVARESALGSGSACRTPSAIQRSTTSSSGNRWPRT
jgi:hypothetical protein